MNTGLSILEDTTCRRASEPRENVAELLLDDQLKTYAKWVAAFAMYDDSGGGRRHSSHDGRVAYMRGLLTRREDLVHNVLRRELVRRLQ